MARRARRNHTPAFKALAAVKGEKTLTELAHSSSTCTLTRSSSGKTSFWKGPPGSSAARPRWMRPGGRPDGPARQDRAACAGERFFCPARLVRGGTAAER